MWIQKEKGPFVYKYCAAPRAAQILRDLTFFFAPAASLNDLYEFRARSLYKEDADSKYRVFAKRLVGEGWWSTFKEAFEATKSLDLDAIDQTYTEFLAQLHGSLSAIMKHSGVTCFTSERNNQRMWGTYGDNHAGAVIEFSTASDRSQFASHLMPVIYTDSKPPLCPSELITENMSLDQWMLGVFFCMKHIHWKEEYEWRLLLLADSEQNTRDRIVPFEHTAITRVFLGPRVSKEHEDLIWEAAASHVQDIPIFKRQIDDDEAKEEFVGFEQIHSFDQLEYWVNHRSRNKE